MNLVYPINYILVAGIGFIIANLMLKKRAGEIAVLRSIGAGRMRILLSLFLEQFLLSIPGIAAGLLAACLIFSGGVNYISHALVLALSYYLGAVLAILRTFKRAVMQSLAQKEE